MKENEFELSAEEKTSSDCGIKRNLTARLNAYGQTHARPKEPCKYSCAQSHECRCVNPIMRSDNQTQNKSTSYLSMGASCCSCCSRMVWYSFSYFFSFFWLICDIQKQRQIRVSACKSVTLTQGIV